MARLSSYANAWLRLRRDSISSYPSPGIKEIAPLKKADDAIYVDSSNMTIDEVVERIKKIISKKRK